jgi:hypothetical protein
MKNFFLQVEEEICLKTKSLLYPEKPSRQRNPRQKTFRQRGEQQKQQKTQKKTRKKNKNKRTKGIK